MKEKEIFDRDGNLIIYHRGIIPERTEDCPNGEFGALVVAYDCDINCEGCFNKQLHSGEWWMQTAKGIVDVICKNPLHKWCILAGLEWSMDPAGLLDIATEAQRRGLSVIIYTGCDPAEFKRRVGDAVLSGLHGCYIKFGKFDNSRPTTSESFGIRLASENQFVCML